MPHAARIHGAVLIEAGIFRLASSACRNAMTTVVVRGVRSCEYPFDASAARLFARGRVVRFRRGTGR